MTTASDLRNEASRLRALAEQVDDGEVREQIEVMIDELENRARQFGDGDASQN